MSDLEKMVNSCPEEPQDQAPSNSGDGEVDIYLAPKLMTAMSAGCAAITTAESLVGVNEAFVTAQLRLAGFAAFGAGCSAVYGYFRER